MSILFQPLNIPNFTEVQAKLLEFVSQPDYSSALTPGQFMWIRDGILLLDTIPEFHLVLDHLGIVPNDVSAGTALETQPGSYTSPIYNNSGTWTFKYTIHIPVTPCTDSFINFYSTASSPVVKADEFNFEFNHFDNDSCTLLERHAITGPFVFDGSVPRSVENGATSPRTYIALGVADTAKIASIFGLA